jgi:hypothetical protein
MNTGRQLALDVLREDALVTFRRIIQTIEPGRLVSVNSLRPLLDAADIPNQARGGLFSQACTAGLLEAAKTPEGYDITIKSTGDSANGSSVRLYRRTTK